MELWRSAANPWGQEVLIGISWDLMWAAVIGGLVFVAAHAVWAKWIMPAASGDSGGGSGIAGLPAQVLRHAMSERVFHWGMSAAMLVLLVTAFAPVMGIQFAWVTIHWVAGIFLTVMIAYHMVHATFFQDFWAMWVEGKDIKAGIAEIKHMIGRNGTEVPKAAKYPIDHKMFHHGAAVSGLAAIVTGIFMMLRLETPFWTANPYMLSDSAWGVMYVVHGVSGVALIALVITHIYFAIRPDKWWITKSMIYGTISSEKYVENHDPSRWAIVGVSSPEEEPVLAGVGASASSEPAAEGGLGDAGDSGSEAGPVAGADESGSDDSDDERASEVGGSD
ncbi:MAG TPA: cytochrome b/b6 domain-containing protein [Gemmatimonadetes bacterium]|nr:cytochrome b/b6 domain-containing protein [Gemmatimonadota bacterium]